MEVANEKTFFLRSGIVEVEEVKYLKFNVGAEDVPKRIMSESKKAPPFTENVSAGVEVPMPRNPPLVKVRSRFFAAVIMRSKSAVESLNPRMIADTAVVDVASTVSTAGLVNVVVPIPDCPVPATVPVLIAKPDATICRRGVSASNETPEHDPPLCAATSTCR